MFGQALRLLAVGEAGQRLGGYVKKLVTKYLVLSVAGMAFLGAIVFAILAGFWALSSSNHDPIISAGIMAAILALVGGLIALTAYGITREKPQQGVSQVIRQPVQALQSQVPSVEDVGRQIERAVRQYGAVRVATAAAAGGLIAGLLAKRFRQI
jgi:membrane associated rhomboid family serine protease